MLPPPSGAGGGTLDRRAKIIDEGTPPSRQEQRAPRSEMAGGFFSFWGHVLSTFAVWHLAKREDS